MKTLRVLTATDLHQSKVLYQDLAQAVAEHRPHLVALVGDFLDRGSCGSSRYLPEECAQLIAALPGEVVLVRGNHEQENWYAFSHAWRATGRPLHALNGAFQFGSLVIIGFPSLLGNDGPFLDGRDALSPDVIPWFSPLVRKFGGACRTLWLMHEPPSGTRLTVNDGGSVSGHPAWREAIETYSPQLVVSGHDHQTPLKTGTWQDKIGETTCVNLGQNNDGPLHYLVIDFNFLKESPSLPASSKLMAVNKQYR